MQIFKFSFIILFLLVFGNSQAQESPNITEDNFFYKVIEDGDTILVSTIDPVHIYQKPHFDTRREWRRYYRLVRNVKKVYPYAKIASTQYDTIARHMLTLNSEREQRKYIKSIESEIMSEYEGELKKLTITQGHILLKLIDREIGETSYMLLQDLKGNFSAFFWQTLARIFGHNLKSEFDPEGEDKLLNEIVILIEAGQL